MTGYMAELYNLSEAHTKNMLSFYRLTTDTGRERYIVNLGQQVIDERGKAIKILLKRVGELEKQIEENGK